MVIAIFCTLLAVLCIVFYFLPAFTVKHKASPSDDFSVVHYSGWDMTKTVFQGTRVMGDHNEGLFCIKETAGYTFPVMLAGLLLPLSIICTITTAVFTYMSWLKSDKFKKFCFLFSLVGMMFATFTLIATWYIAIQIKDGNNFDFFYYNLKGTIAYGAFVSLILAFVVAIIACAYNYFLDNFDDEEETGEEEKPAEEKKEEEKETAAPVIEAKVEEQKPAQKPAQKPQPKRTATGTRKTTPAKKPANK